MKKLVLLFIIGVLITASCTNDSEVDLTADIVDNMNTLFAPTNINYIQKYINENNNKNQFLQNKILDNIATIKKRKKVKIIQKI